MKWLTLAAIATLAACSHQNQSDQAKLEQERLKAEADALFNTVEEHAGCAGFHRAHAKSRSTSKSKADFHTNAASNAETAATEIASTKMQKDLAVEMVSNISETHAAEWGYAIEANANQQSVLSQETKCETLAEKQKEIVRDIVKAKYGFRK